LITSRTSDPANYPLDFVNWTTISGAALFNLVGGDFNVDGRDDLAGVNSAGRIYYSLDLASWVNIPETLTQLAVGDLNNDGRDNLVGTTSTGSIFYTLDLANWQYGATEGVRAAGYPK